MPAQQLPAAVCTCLTPDVDPVQRQVRLGDSVTFLPTPLRNWWGRPSLLTAWLLFAIFVLIVHVRQGAAPAYPIPPLGIVALCRNYGPLDGRTLALTDEPRPGSLATCDNKAAMHFVLLRPRACPGVGVSRWNRVVTAMLCSIYTVMEPSAPG